MGSRRGGFAPLKHFFPLPLVRGRGIKGDRVSLLPISNSGDIIAISINVR
jgi:hypothetical protein